MNTNFIVLPTSLKLHVVHAVCCRWRSSGVYFLKPNQVKLKRPWWITTAPLSHWAAAVSNRACPQRIHTRTARDSESAPHVPSNSPLLSSHSCLPCTIWCCKPDNLALLLLFCAMNGMANTVLVNVFSEWKWKWMFFFLFFTIFELKFNSW